MGRCGCSGECNCVVIEGDCITVSGSGNPGSPYSIAVEIDPDPSNQVACGDPGLFVPPPSIEVADTPCVNLDGTGFPGDPVTATLILDPEPCNLLVCNDPEGLDAQISTLSSDCATLDGCGTPLDPLTVIITPSPDPGNTLACRNNGLFVPAAGAPAIDTFVVIHDLGGCPTVMPPAAAGFESTAFINYDTVESSSGLLVFPCGGPTWPYTYVELPLGADGWYQITATHPGWDVGPIATGDEIWRLEIQVGNAGVAQTAQTRYTTTSSPTDFNTPYLHVSRTIYLVGGEQVMVMFSSVDYLNPFAGATLSFLPIVGSAFTLPFRAGLPFFEMVKVGV